MRYGGGAVWRLVINENTGTGKQTVVKSLRSAEVQLKLKLSPQHCLAFRIQATWFSRQGHIPSQR